MKAGRGDEMIKMVGCRLTKDEIFGNRFSKETGETKLSVQPRVGLKFRIEIMFLVDFFEGEGVHI